MESSFQDGDHYENFRLRAGVAVIWIVVSVVIVAALSVSAGYLFGKNLDIVTFPVETQSVTQSTKTTTTPTSATPTVSATKAAAASLFATDAKHGGMQFNVPANYGVFFNSQCEGGCQYAYRFGTLDSSQVVSTYTQSGFQVIVNALAKEMAVDEYINDINFKADKKLGGKVVGGVNAQEYLSEGMVNEYTLVFTKGKFGYRIDMTGAGTADDFRADTLLKSVVDSWKFNS